MRAFLLEQGPAVRRAVLLVMVIGLPLAFMPSLYGSYDTPKLALLFAGTASVAAIRIAEILQGNPVHLRPMLIPAAAVAVPLMISWMFGPYKAWALFGEFGRFDGLLPNIALIVFSGLVFDAFRKEPLPVARSLVVAGAGVSTYALLQRVGIDPFLASVDLPTPSTVGNPNVTSAIAGISFVLALALQSHDHDWRSFHRFAAAACLGGVLVAVSQSGQAAAVAGGAVVLGWLGQGRWSAARSVGFLVAGLVFVTIVGAVAYGAVRPEDERLPDTVRQRGEFWHAGLALAARAPVAGHGPGTFGLFGTRHRSDRLATRWPTTLVDDPHSVPLTLISSAGLIGLAGLVTLVHWIAVVVLRLRTRGMLSGAYMAGLIAYLVQSIFTINDLALRAMFWTLLAGIAVLVSMDPDERRRGARSRAKPSREISRRRSPSYRNHRLRFPVPVGIVAVFALAAIVWSGVILLADRNFRRGVDMLRGDGVPPALAMSEFDRALNLWGDYEYRRVAGFLAGQQAVGLAESENAPPAAGSDLHEYSMRLLSYSQDFPDVQAVFAYARTLEAWADATGDEASRTRAAAMYERLLELDPNNPQHTIDLERVLHPSPSPS